MTPCAVAEPGAARELAQPPQMPEAIALDAHRPFWAKRLGVAKFLPTSRAEMDALGWDSCDVIIVSGDAYVDHPSFGMAVIGRMLEHQGFRVGIIAQPAWQSVDDFRALGRPNLFWGVTAGNMDSMINRYTADRKLRSDDAYTPGGLGGQRPDRAATVYAQRCRQAFADVPIVLGGIEASLRRIAHYDYWQDKVKRSVLLDAKADLLLYGNAERAVVEIAHRLAAREAVSSLTDVRGTAFVRKPSDPQASEWFELDSSEVDRPGRVDQYVNPYRSMSEEASLREQSCARDEAQPGRATPGVKGEQPLRFVPSARAAGRLNLPPRDRTVIRLPSYEQVSADPVLYAHANRVLHLETNPGNARALVQAHGEGAAARDVWISPPPVPLSTREMDLVFDLPYARAPHPRYGQATIPAWDMIRFSVNIMRGCFGGCTFCSITEHEGRIIQSRSEQSVLREIALIRDQVPGFTGVISDLGGPTANMYRIGCKSASIEAACRKPSCVYPDICSNLHTDHGPLIRLYRRARALPGIKKILIGSGLRYDLAVRSPEYIQELVTHHVGGYLKIAPEHTEGGPLSKMMKPGMGAYDRFKELFEHYSELAGKKQYLVPYFIAAHPGTRDEDMMNLAIWLKRNGFKADQVQTFYPSPMATATAMYHSGLNPLKGLSRDPQRAERVDIVKGERRRRLHKAFLRYHDPANWPLLRDALKAMGRRDLIGNGPNHLIPSHQPVGELGYQSARRKNSTVAGAKTSLVTSSRLARQGAAGSGLTSTGQRVKAGIKGGVPGPDDPRDLPGRPGASAKPGVRKPAPKGQAVKGQLLTQHTGLPPRQSRVADAPSRPRTSKKRPRVA